MSFRRSRRASSGARTGVRSRMRHSASVWARRLASTWTSLVWSLKIVTVWPAAFAKQASVRIVSCQSSRMGMFMGRMLNCAPYSIKEEGMIRIPLLAVSLWLGAAAAASATELQWWSHWAIEDNKKVVLFEAKRRFEAKNPGHTVTITFYEKKNMFTALRAAFTAGSGFPDVLYYDIDAPEFMQAGWMADLSTGVRWENIEPFGKAFWTRPGPGGKTGIWALPLEGASDEVYYNRKAFKQLGITVPAAGAFTQEQFKEVVGKCA